MRISDWSSDVCSSDLLLCECLAHFRFGFDASPLHGEATTLEQAHRQRAVAGVVFDQQHAQRLTHDAFPCGGASLITSQYMPSWVMASTKRSKLTGLRM